MTDFDLYNEQFKQFTFTSSDTSSSDTSSSDNSSLNDSSNDICKHLNMSVDKGVNICTTCGEEIIKELDNMKEWKYYGQTDNKPTFDPNRLQIRKVEERSIYKDVENMGFSDKIINVANKIYYQVTHGQIFRGNSRKAIVFACIFHAYKQSDKPQSHEKLIDIFNLNKKVGLKGLKHVNLYTPKTPFIQMKYITPINIIEEIMEKFDGTKEQISEVCELYNNVKNKSSKLNRCRPQSIASGLIYHWICKKKKNITLTQFAVIVNLSELTISKIETEIEKILS